LGAVLIGVTTLNLALAIWSLRVARSARAASNTAGSAPAGSVSSGGDIHPPATRRPLPDLSFLRPMNGIDLSAVGRFWETWTLADVRYRTDNGEQRFVYANDLAWKAMKEKAATYPDGAMFGKLAFHGETDPAFPASIEPDSFTRLQVMSRDSKLYPDTDGWGYAVVTYQGDRQTPAEDGAVALACHACHRLVAARDFVFSRSPFVRLSPGVSPDLRSHFRPVAVASLGPTQQKVLGLLGKNTPDKVLFYAMPMFTGSADESSGALARYATEDHKTYFLSDASSGHFVLADGSPIHEDAGAGACEPGTRVAFSSSKRPPGLVPDTVMLGALCGAHVRWNSVRPLSAVTRQDER
jgi:hypothetical protein